MTSQTPSATDLTTQLTQIGLHATAGNLDDFIARAAKGRWSVRAALEEMTRMELHERAGRSLQRRLSRSRLGRFKPMSDYDWNWPKKIDRAVIERALTLEFIEEGRNLILMGSNGLGKTMISKNIALAAVERGRSVLFKTAAELIEDLEVDSAQLRRRKLAQYGRPQLLCIDEVGYLSYDSHAADLLYEVINRRYEQKSLIVTTNRAFKEWNQVFPNATCIATLLDRLTHHADVTVIEGQSYRVRESESESAKRRGRK